MRRAALRCARRQEEGVVLPASTRPSPFRYADALDPMKRACIPSRFREGSPWRVTGRDRLIVQPSETAEDSSVSSLWHAGCSSRQRGPPFHAQVPSSE